MEVQLTKIPCTITARQLEALVRLAEASTRIRLGDEVTAEDAKRSIVLQEKCLKQVGYDPETGKVDIDKVEGRTPKSDRDKSECSRNHQRTGRRVWRTCPYQHTYN